MPNGPVPPQYPYPSPYQQYPPYTPVVSSTNEGVVKSGLIGGAIACGINILVTLLLTFVPAIGSVTATLYQIVPLLPSGILSVGGFIVSLIVALLCSPGFFVVGLLATRKTGRMNSAMLACTLALTVFAVVDLGLGIASAYYSLIVLFPSYAPGFLEFWEIVIVGWFADIIMASMVSFGAAALGGAIGRQKRL
jgi:hypothetical protein